jgi:hypothetical protein
MTASCAVEGVERGLDRVTVARAGEELIEAIKRREDRLTKSENLTMKFLEVKDFVISVSSFFLFF